MVTSWGVHFCSKMGQIPIIGPFPWRGKVTEKGSHACCHAPDPSPRWWQKPGCTSISQATGLYGRPVRLQFHPGFCSNVDEYLGVMEKTFTSYVTKLLQCLLPHVFGSLVTWNVLQVIGRDLSLAFGPRKPYQGVLSNGCTIRRNSFF